MSPKASGAGTADDPWKLKTGAMYVPPLLEHLGLVELEHHPKNNRVRAR